MAMNIDKANRFDLAHHMHPMEKCHGIRTLMDRLRAFTSTQCTNNDRFFAVLSYEEYDSESVKYDLEDRSQSNLALHSSACYNAMDRYLYLIKLHRNTFSMGYRFYYHYWSQFQSEALYSTLNTAHTPMNDDPNDLQSRSIRAKYESLQEEILNNSISNLSKNQFDLSLVRSHKY
eukprot:958086_1